MIGRSGATLFSSGSCEELRREEQKLTWCEADPKERSLRWQDSCTQVNRQDQIHIIKEHMQKAMRLGDYHYPYAVLIYNFLHFFEANLEDETSELVKSTQELNNGSLNKMGFTKVGGKWISKDGDHGASSSGAANLEQDEPADMDVQHEDPTENFQDAGPSAADGHQRERMPTMSSFERLMM